MDYVSYLAYITAISGYDISIKNNELKNKRMLGWITLKA